MLAIPPCMNVGAAIEYYDNDSTIAVVLEGVHDYQQAANAYDEMFNHCFATGKYGVLLICTGDVDIIDQLGKEIGCTYMLVPTGWDISSVRIPEHATGLEADSDDMRDIIQSMWGYVRFPVFKDKAKAEKVAQYIDAATNDIIRGDCLKQYDMCLDHHGRAIIRTVNPVIDTTTTSGKEHFAKVAGISMHEIEYAAYVGVDFVILSKEDARAIADLLDQVVEERGGDDVKAFGDKGISYERLHDRLTGLLYDSSINTNSKKEEHDNA